MKEYVLLTGAGGTLAKELIKDLNKKNCTVIGVSSQVITDDKNIYINLNLMDNGSVKELFEVLKKKELFPNKIIHNLGGKIKGDEHPLSYDVLESTLKLNLGIAVEINSYFINKALEKDKKLNILHVSSDCALNGKASPAYSSIKSAINAYVKSTARKYILNNIILCSVLPGKFCKDIECVDNNMDLPLGRYLKASEISSFIVDIISSNNVIYTGNTFLIDGSKN